jgi:SAM-dependent methyltransferase
VTVGLLHERTRWVFEHLPKGIDRLLDAGCHDARGTAEFARLARRTTGIDVDVAALRRGDQLFPHLQLLCASGAALPFADGAFDCVVFSEVIEHVPAHEEEACIAEIHRVLTTGGTLILTTPHYGRFWWLDPLLFKTHVRRFRGRLLQRPVQIKGHHHYRVSELRSLLQPYFDIQLVERTGQLLYPLAYWGHLLPLGLGQRPMLVQLWQWMMDFDYSHEHGSAAYNVCIVATARTGA